MKVYSTKLTLVLRAKAAARPGGAGAPGGRAARGGGRPGATEAAGGDRGGRGGGRPGATEAAGGAGGRGRPRRPGGRAAGGDRGGRGRPRRPVANRLRRGSPESAGWGGGRGRPGGLVGDLERPGWRAAGGYRSAGVYLCGGPVGRAALVVPEAVPGGRAYGCRPRRPGGRAAGGDRGGRGGGRPGATEAAGRPRPPRSPVAVLAFRVGETTAESNSADITEVFTREGDDAILPCGLDSPVDLTDEAFDWKKGKQEVFFYIQGMDYNKGREGQDPHYVGRVHLLQGGLQAGNASVVLSSVTQADGGVYKCVILTKQTIRLIRLTVVVEPRLRVEVVEARPSSGWMRLSCVSRGGQPQPSGLEWQTPNGTVIPAEEAPPAASSDSDGRYSISQTVEVTEPGNYTCRARQQGVHPAVTDTIRVFGHWLTGDRKEVLGNGTWKAIVAYMNRDMEEKGIVDRDCLPPGTRCLLPPPPPQRGTTTARHHLPLRGRASAAVLRREPHPHPPP
ncbi:unnamed protein product [Boreogadus saida]